MEHSKGLGGSGEGTNPEQLFALGWANCFNSAVLFVAGQKKIDAAKAVVTCEVGDRPRRGRPWAFGEADACSAGYGARASARTDRSGAPGVPVFEGDAEQHSGRAGGGRMNETRRAARALDRGAVSGGGGGRDCRAVDELGPQPTRARTERTRKRRDGTAIKRPRGAGDRRRCRRRVRRRTAGYLQRA